MPRAGRPGKRRPALGRPGAAGYAASVGSLPDLPDTVLDYLRRRRRLLVRLEWVGRTLLRWEAWETNVRLTNDLQRPVPPPVLPREALDGLHELLTEELARLDGARRPGG
jgi:hypothetical protein